MRKRTTLALASASALSLAAAPSTLAAPGTGVKGPTTTVAPYVLPTADGTEVTSLLTVKDLATPNGYKMVGIPDGLGARRLPNGDVDVFMTHELPGDAGIVRAHGQKGSFVANLKIDAATLAVKEGKDLIDSSTDLTYYDYPSATFGATPSTAGTAPNPLFAAQGAAFNRFCSATLSGEGTLLNETTGNGYDGQVFFGNEEGGNNSRVFGILDDGTTKQLPRLGLFSWENTIPAENQTDTTLVQGQEDATPGQIWTYVGKKVAQGDAFQRAGLENGKNYVADVVNQAVTNDATFRSTIGKGVATPVVFNEVDWNQPADAQNTQGVERGLSLTRVEDGHWNPQNPEDFYFLTTEGGNTTPAPGTTDARNGGGLWRLRYKDIENPLRGATLTLLLDGSEAPFLDKPDNMTIDTHGNLLIQEDPGGDVSLARIVAYEIATGRRGVVATFDPALFSAAANPMGAPEPRTIDEESSGIIDGRGTFGDGSFLLDAQVHRTVANDTDGLVQHGQLMLLEVEDFSKVYPAVVPPRDGATGATGTTGAPGTPGSGGNDGSNGNTGPAGPKGEAGGQGVQGTQGAPGLAGAPGLQGPAGAIGPRGLAGANARTPRVTCTQAKRGKKITCKVSFSSSSRAAKVRLVKGRRTVATGRLVKGVARFSGTRLTKGTYTLVTGTRSMRLVNR